MNTEIIFPGSFSNVLNGEYLLIQFPPAFLEKIESGDNLELEQDESNQVILRNPQTKEQYSASKIEVSNSLMFATGANSARSEVLTLQQGYVVFDKIAGANHQIEDYLQTHQITSSNDFKQELRISYIEATLGLSKEEICAAARALGGVVDDEQVYVYEEKIFFQFANEIVNQVLGIEGLDISGFRIEDVSSITNYPKVRIEATLQRILASNKLGIYEFSALKIIRLAVYSCIAEMNYWVYDEFREIVEKHVQAFLPISLREGLTDEEIDYIISNELSEVAIIEDNIDYKVESSNYDPKNLIISRIDSKSLSLVPKERLIQITKYRELFSRSELENYFSRLFSETKKLEKFLKRYFVKVVRVISEKRYPILKKVYAKYKKEGLLRQHPMLSGSYELTIFSARKGLI